MGTLTTIDLPPARRALAELAAEIKGSEHQLGVLEAGMARLETDIAKVKDAEGELASLVAKDADDVLSRLRAGLDWAIDRIGGVHADVLAERLAASRHQAAVAERALSATQGEIERLRAHIADLKGRKGSYVAAAVREASRGLFEDYVTVVEQLREAMTHIAALERHLGVERIGRITATVLDPNWSDGLPEQIIDAPEREIRKAQAVFARFAEALAADPRAPADLEFDPVDPSPDADLIYHSLTLIEQRRIAAQHANA